MCKICALAARYTPARQDSLVFNLSQFAAAVTAKPVTEPSQPQSTPLEMSFKSVPTKTTHSPIEFTRRGHNHGTTHFYNSL
jgi:hypothetical protein